MLNLTRMLFHGDGIGMDREKANMLYQKVIDKGEIDAMYRFAKLYDINDEYPVDKKAARIFKIAANADHTKSILNYGTMLLHGDGIERNEREAHIYLSNVEKGYIDSKNELKYIE